MIFSGDLENCIRQAFLRQHHAGVVWDAGSDCDRLQVQTKQRRQVSIELRREPGYLVAATVIGPAVTLNVLQLALTFMDWQEYPQYALSLRGDAHLVMGCTRAWPSAHSERDLEDMIIGLAETAGMLTTAIERRICHLETVSGQ